MPDVDNFRRRQTAYTQEPSGPAAIGGATPLTNRAIEMALEAPADMAPAAAPAPKQISLPAWLTMIGGNAADIGSTIHALGNGAVEQNPIFGENPSVGRLIGTKAAGVGIQALLMKMLERRGKAGIANGLGYASGAVGGGLAVNNMIQAGKAKKHGS